MRDERLIRIVVLEDDPAIRKLLVRILERTYQLRFARDGEHLLSLVELGLVDLVLLDLMLPGENGMEVGRILRARSALPIVILSALSGSLQVTEGLDSFADDYMTKPFIPEVLRSRIASVRRRYRSDPREGSDSSPLELELDGCAVDPRERTIVADDGCKAYLTEREYQLLVYLCRCAGRAVSRDELSRAVAGRVWDPDDRSLDVHVCNLRYKLARVLPGKRIIQAVRCTGYRLALVPVAFRQTAGRNARSNRTMPAVAGGVTV